MLEQSLTGKIIILLLIGWISPTLAALIALVWAIKGAYELGRRTK